jgi:hypothetical protein
LPIHRARGQISSRKDRQIGDDCDGVEEGGKVKNWQGKIWEVPSDHNTTKIYKGGPQEKNFQKEKKLAGEDPPDPLPTYEKTNSFLLCMDLQPYSQDCFSKNIKNFV